MVKLERQNRTDDLDHYQALSRQKLSYEINNNLGNGENPALMGDKFMRERATDGQLQDMIDRSYEVQKELIENDRYIRRKEHYQMTHDQSIQDIELLGKELSQHYQRDDIKPEEIPVLLEKYYDQPDAADLFAGKSLEYFKKSLDNFDYTNNVLQKINEREMQIAEEVSGHIDTINSIRVGAKMDEYKKQVPRVARQQRSIEDHLPRARE